MNQGTQRLARGVYRRWGQGEMVLPHRSQQGSDSFFTAPAEDGPPLGKMLAADLQCPGDIGQFELGVFAQVLGQVGANLIQRQIAPRTNRQQVPGRRRCSGRPRRWLLQDDVRIGSAEAKRTHSRTPEAVRRGPGLLFGTHPEGKGGEINAGIGATVVQTWNQSLVVQHQGSFDESGDPGRTVQMADVRLHRPDGAHPLRQVWSKRLPQGFQLDRITQGSGGPVCLEVTYRLARHIGQRQGFLDDSALPRHAGSVEIDFVGSVVVDGRSLDDGPDGVSIRQRIGQTLEGHHADAVAGHRPTGLTIEGAAVAIPGKHQGLVVDVARLGELYTGSSSQGHVALAIAQRLASDVDSHQRAGTGRLHHQAGAAEIQLVRDAGGGVILVLARRRDQMLHCRAQWSLGIGAFRHREVDAHRARHTLRVVARLFQGYPGTFEQEPLLGVKQLGMARDELEEIGIEAVDVIQYRPRRHKARLLKVLGRNAKGGAVPPGRSDESIPPRRRGSARKRSHPERLGTGTPCQ